MSALCAGVSVTDELTCGGHSRDLAKDVDTGSEDDAALVGRRHDAGILSGLEQVTRLICKADRRFILSPRLP